MRLNAVNVKICENAGVSSCFVNFLVMLLDAKRLP